MTQHITIDLYPAFNAFIDCIKAANHQRPDEDLLEDAYTARCDGLDYRMRLLEQSAAAGAEKHVTSLLATHLQEWSIKEALALLLKYGWTLDPDSGHLQQAFWQKLDRAYRDLSAKFLLVLEEARQQRAKTQEERDQSWQAVAYRSLEDQRNQHHQWHNAAFQWVQGQQQMNQQWFEYQQQMFNHYQQANQQWANTAMMGAEQAQAGLKQWYDFAASTQTHVASMLAGTEQRQAAVVEQAVQRATTKKWMTRIMLIGLVLIGMVALFGGAFVALMHLY